MYPEEDAPLVLGGAAALGMSLWWAFWGAVCAASERLRGKMAHPLLIGGLAAAVLVSGIVYWATEYVPAKVESLLPPPAPAAGVRP